MTTSEERPKLNLSEINEERLDLDGLDVNREYNGRSMLEMEEKGRTKENMREEDAQDRARWKEPIMGKAERRRRLFMC